MATPAVRMLVATLDVVLEWSMPEADEVEASFEYVRSQVETWWAGLGESYTWTHPGMWAGPVRITRRNRGTGYTMTVACPWFVPGESDEDIAAHLHTMAPETPLEAFQHRQEQALSEVESQLTDALHGIDAAWQVSSTNYSGAINGDLTWWSSGQAARTRTRFAAPGVFGVAAAVENPVGPDSAALRPATVTETIAEGGRNVFRGAAPLVLLVVGTLLVVQFIGRRQGGAREAYG